MFDIVCQVSDSSKDVICGAWIQGICTLGAGVLALVAGHFAYKAATNETRIHQEKEKQRRLAYRFLMKLVLTNLLKDIILCRHAINKKEVKILIIPKEIQAHNWENHALLTEDIIDDIHRIYPLLEVNYFYALHCIKQKHYDEHCRGLITHPDDHLEESKKKKGLEDWMIYENSNEYQVYKIRCGDKMKKKDFKNNLVEITSILEKLIKKLTQVS